jgi:hypothetical protein
MRQRKTTPGSCDLAETGRQPALRVDCNRWCNAQCPMLQLAKRSAQPTPPDDLTFLLGFASAQARVAEPASCRRPKAQEICYNRGLSRNFVASHLSIQGHPRPA